VKVSRVTADRSGKSVDFLTKPLLLLPSPVKKKKKKKNRRTKPKKVKFQTFSLNGSFAFISRLYAQAV